MHGATIGIRRMQSHMDLMPLKKSVDSHLGMIKQKENTYQSRVQRARAQWVVQNDTSNAVKGGAQTVPNYKQIFELHVAPRLT